MSEKVLGKKTKNITYFLNYVLDHMFKYRQILKKYIKFCIFKQCKNDIYVYI